MAKYPKKLVKFNTFNIIELISNATDIDISTIRQIDISLDTITYIEINHIEIRSEDLNDYRYEIVNNRRDIDIYKDGVVNIDFNNREEDNNSNCEIINDEYRAYTCNRKVNIINISIRKTSITSIIERKREDDYENNDKIYMLVKAHIPVMGYIIVRGELLLYTPVVVRSNRIPPPCVFATQDSTRKDSTQNFNIKSRDQKFAHSEQIGPNTHHYGY